MSGGVKGGGEVIFSALHLYHNTVKTVSQAKSSDDYIDILSIYSNMTINESILSPFQTGSITINDSNDMVPDYPIAGGNIVHLTYNVQDGPPETEIDSWFRVVNVKNVIINERKQAYTLQLISEDGWKNMHTVLTSAFSGQPSEMITKIFSQYLNAGDKRLATDASVGGLKLVCPHWKPSQAISWIANKALSATTDSPGFFFYETMRGFRFLSTDTLLNKDRNLIITDVMADVQQVRPEGSVKKGYLYKIPGVPITGSDGKPVSGMVGSESVQNVDDFRILERNSIGKDIVGGYLATKHITHDLFNKSITVNEFKYFDDFNKIQRLSDSVHYEYPAEPLNTDMSIMLTPKHQRIHSDRRGAEGYRTVYSDDYALKRKFIMKQINDEVIDNFEVPGATIMEAGRLLEFNYPAIRTVNEPEDAYQSKYSGHYLIRDVVHIFRPVANTTTSYKVDMNIVKDGWNDA